MVDLKSQEYGKGNNNPKNMGKEIKNGNNSKGNCRENIYSAREEQGGSYIFSQNAHFFFYGGE